MNFKSLIFLVFTALSVGCNIDEKKPTHPGTPSTTTGPKSEKERKEAESEAATTENMLKSIRNIRQVVSDHEERINDIQMRTEKLESKNAGIDPVPKQAEPIRKHEIPATIQAAEEKPSQNQQKAVKPTGEPQKRDDPPDSSAPSSPRPASDARTNKASIPPTVTPQRYALVDFFLCFETRATLLINGKTSVRCPVCNRVYEVEASETSHGLSITKAERGRPQYGERLVEGIRIRRQ